MELMRVGTSFNTLARRRSMSGAGWEQTVLPEGLKVQMSVRLRGRRRSHAERRQYPTQYWQGQPCCYQQVMGFEQKLAVPLKIVEHLYSARCKA